jgi:thiamine-phosphate pyrophosphorylase
MSDFEKLSNVFDYVFWTCFRKPKYVSDIDFEKELKNKETKQRINCSWRITSERIKTALNYGFDDVALRYHLEQQQPNRNYKLCQQIALSY